MHAISFSQYGAPDVLAYGNWPDPVPTPDQVLIAVRSAGVGAGDCKVRAGLLQHHHRFAMPKIPGRNGAGEVIACGAAVDYAHPGDRVIFFARHAENGSAVELIARGRDEIAPLPVEIGFVEASALVQPALCALVALDEVAQLRAGHSVLIHGGAGAVGAQAVLLARHVGARVVATARAAKADYVRALGAHQVLPYDQMDFSTTDERFDVVYDLVGGDTHARSYRVLKRGGTMVCLVAAPFVDRSAEHGVRTIVARIEDTRARLVRVLDLARQGVFRPQVARVLPLAECAAAHRLVESGEQGPGRVVLAVP
jgi:NADPH:quinone reductase-like Zn-dependent oxidoreductase